MRGWGDGEMRNDGAIHQDYFFGYHFAAVHWWGIESGGDGESPIHYVG